MPADYRNDAVHPMLSRARPLQQATLDAGPGRDSYGTCAVLESSGAGGLTDFTMGGHVTGEAWSVNPYAGCLHACSYCYVPDTLHAERKRWGTYVIVKRDLPTRLAHAVVKAEGAGKRQTAYFSTATDPYQPAEQEHLVTRRCLEVLARRDWPVEILTRSPLVLRDLDLFRQFSQVRVGLSIPTLDDDLRKVLEPNAPPIAARLKALRRLSDEGFPTFANYTPACPPTTHGADAIAKAFLDAGAQWVNSTRWKRRATTLGPLWERLRETPWEEMTRFFASKPRQHEWKKELGAAFRRVGLPLGGSFFNPPFEWLQQERPEPTVQADLSPQGLQRFAPLPVIGARRARDRSATSPGGNGVPRGRIEAVNRVHAQAGT
jgi:DNA repair photolyase